MFKRTSRTFCIIFVCFLAACTQTPSVDTSDTTDYLDLRNIRMLVDNGEYEKALEKHMWYHEASKNVGGLGGVRLSYALNDWYSLGEKYPPALFALTEVRDSNYQAIISGDEGFTKFLDLKALNDTLGEQEKTIALFELVDQKFPENAQRFYSSVEDLLLTEKKLKLISKYMEDPIFKYERLRFDREQSLSEHRKENKADSFWLSYANDRFVEKVLKLIEALVLINRKDDANEVYQRATQYFDHPEIKQAL